jgi:hypothetical protein
MALAARRRIVAAGLGDLSRSFIQEPEKDSLLLGPSKGCGP